MSTGGRAGRALIAQRPPRVWWLEHRHAEGSPWSLVADGVRAERWPLYDEMRAPTFARGYGDLVRLRCARAEEPPVTAQTWVEVARGPVALGPPATPGTQHCPPDADWVTAWEGPAARGDFMLRSPGRRATRTQLVDAALACVGGAAWGREPPALVAEAVAAAHAWRESQRPTTAPGGRTAEVAWADLRRDESAWAALKRAVAARDELLRASLYDAMDAPRRQLFEAAHWALVAAVGERAGDGDVSDMTGPWGAAALAAAHAGCSHHDPPNPHPSAATQCVMASWVRGALPLSVLVLTAAGEPP